MTNGAASLVYLFMFLWDSLEECFGDAHRDIEWMDKNNPATLW